MAMGILDPLPLLTINLSHPKITTTRPAAIFPLPFIALHVSRPRAFSSRLFIALPGRPSACRGCCTQREKELDGRGKKPSYSIADGAFPTGKGALVPATADPSSTSSPPSPGYFSSVFPPAPAAMGKDSVGSDLYWTLNRQRTSGRIGDAKGAAPGGRSQSSPIKKQTTQSKDGTPVDPIQSEESVYFSSSVHYGGRDFYDSSASSQVPGTPKTYKDDKEEDSSDPNVANRGEWWQGSLYY